jgi:hypothetical protein
MRSIQQSALSVLKTTTKRREKYTAQSAIPPGWLTPIDRAGVPTGRHRAHAAGDGSPA